MERRIGARLGYSQNLDQTILKIVGLAEEIRRCTKCFLYRCCTQPLIGIGYPLASIMLLKGCPTKVEDQSGVAYSGMIATVLKQGLRRIQIDVTDIYATNAIKCTAKEKIVSEYQREACLPYLKAEIEIVKPKLIVAMGKMATDMLMRMNGSLYGSSGFSSGKIIEWKKETEVLMTESFSTIIKDPAISAQFWELLTPLRSYQ